MRPHIRSIETLSANSASTSDTWIVNFNKKIKIRPGDEREYGDLTITYDTAFMKIFFYFVDVGKKSESYESMRALAYEAIFYVRVTNPLIFSGACPYFVTCYDSNYDCTFDQMAALLTGTVKPSLTEEEIRENLMRNAAYMLRELPYRPALAAKKSPKKRRRRMRDEPSVIVIDLDDVDPETITAPEAMKLRYCCTLNQSMKGAATYAEWLYKKKKENSAQASMDIWAVVFQIAIACYAIFLSHAIHNDLHSGNIYIKESHGKPVMYEIDGKIYTFAPKYVPYLYDFDRGYIEWQGKNLINVGVTCVKSAQCNELVSNKDFIKSCCYLVDTIPSAVPQLTEILGSKDGAFDKIKKDKKCWLRESKTKAFTSDWFMKSFSPITDIIPRLYQQVEGVSSSNIDTSDIHCLGTAYFDSKGKIDAAAIVERIRKLSWTH